MAVQASEIETLLKPYMSSKATLSRVRRFAHWAARNADNLYCIPLDKYRDHLKTKFTDATVSAYLSAVRASYHALLDNLNDDTKRQQVRKLLDSAPWTYTAKQQQETAFSVGVWLTREQASILIASPGIDTLAGLRDTALLSLALCTGLRVNELCELKIADLKVVHHNRLSCYVRNGKGSKDRYIAYGEAVWCLDIVDRWIEQSEIEGGTVFRGLYKPRDKGTQKLRDGPLAVRSIQKIVSRYPIWIGSKLTTIRAHDLRRTYARRCFEDGVSLEALSELMGHASLAATLLYLGPDIQDRTAPTELYDPPPTP